MRFDSKMVEGWQAVLKKFFSKDEETGDISPKAKFTAWYDEATKSKQDEKEEEMEEMEMDDAAKKKKKRKKKKKKKTRSHKTIPWEKWTLDVFWITMLDILSRYGLIIVISQKISWRDCPVREICVYHEMSTADRNFARSKYPKTHTIHTKYKKCQGIHVCCRIHKYGIHGGCSHVVNGKQRCREHLLWKSAHGDNYHYMEMVMLSVSLKIMNNNLLYF